MSEGKKKGVLLLAFGGADAIENVAPFVKNVLKGRPVSDETVKHAEKRYALIGGSSPLLKITLAEADALKVELASLGLDTEVYVGMRFWHPYIKETVRDMWMDGVEDALAVIMAPHTSRVATGGYLADIEEARKTTAGVPEVRYASTWHTHPLFIEAIKDNIDAALKTLPLDKKTLLLFTAHSLPAPALAGDSYVGKINETIEAVTKGANLPEHRLAYQSKGGGPVEWLGPAAEDEIEKAAKDGFGSILIVPVGFVSDHVETLYDIDILFKDIALKAGLNFARSLSLNTSPKFIKMLADVVLNNIKGSA
ncbi:MAG: ferrochelatase [Deltaproteobacteria bacterium]|nr:ferrochelatase [Deltaproteobacteria bacterium]